MQNHIARLNWLVAFILFIALMIVVFSCGGSKKKNGTTKNGFDTTRVLIMTVAPDGSNLWEGYGERIVGDTTLWNLKDSVTLKKESVVDSMYRIPYYPSWHDTAANVIYLDSATGRIKTGAWWNIQKNFVRSGWDDADSARNYLIKFVKPKK